jgi:hypothetical protein
MKKNRGKISHDNIPLSLELPTYAVNEQRIYQPQEPKLSKSGEGETDTSK